MLFKNLSLTLLVVNLSKYLGIIIFQYPFKCFKFSYLGIFFMLSRLIFNVFEITNSMNIDSSFYSGPSEVLNTIALINLIVYALHHFLISLFNVICCKKMFKLFREIEELERKVKYFCLSKIQLFEQIAFQLGDDIKFKIIVFINVLIKFTYSIVILQEENLLLWSMRILTNLYTYTPLEIYFYVIFVIYKGLNQTHEELE